MKCVRNVGWEMLLEMCYVAVLENGGWRIGTNKEINDTYAHPDLVNVIKAARIPWFRHVARMEEQRLPKRINDCKPGDERRRGRPRPRGCPG